MSVATEFAPTVTIPARARARAATLAPVPPLGVRPLGVAPFGIPPLEVPAPSVSPRWQPADVAFLRPPVVEPAPAAGEPASE